MNKFMTQTMTPSRLVMPISGHRCVQGMTRREAVIVRDGVVATQSLALGTSGAYGTVKGAFPGPVAWSPPT